MRQSRSIRSRFAHLPADVELVEAKNADSPSPQAAATAVKVAEAQVKAAQARLVSLEATLAADRAKFAILSVPIARRLGEISGETASRGIAGRCECTN